MPCQQMIKTRHDLMNTLKSFRKKKNQKDRGGVDVSDLTNDIKLVVGKLEQIDRDIRTCTKKEIDKKNKRNKKKQQKHKTEPIKLKPIEVSLDTATNEKPHGTGNRGAYFTK